ncbi:HNH endonuclease domain-containing protein [Paraglaciecola arctica]|uniref:HNH endonuclease domain-containing protein n=1 Tax=Paraglaciecola arctica TaxID=1128911 RepID=UPI003F5412C3
MECVWSAKPLILKYDVDHNIPFSRRPNSNLWNLVPSNIKVNNEKRDKLPSNKKFNDARQRLKQWWQKAL